MSLYNDLQDDFVLRDKDYWVPAFGITICVSLAAAGTFSQWAWLAYLNTTICLIGLGLYVFLAFAFLASAISVSSIKPERLDAGEDLQKVILVENINNPRLVFNILSISNIIMLHYIGGIFGPILLAAYVLILLCTKFIKTKSRQVLKAKILRA